MALEVRPGYLSERYKIARIHAIRVIHHKHWEHVTV